MTDFNVDARSTLATDRIARIRSDLPTYFTQQGESARPRQPLAAFGHATSLGVSMQWVVRDRCGSLGDGQLRSGLRSLIGLRLSAACRTGTHRKCEREPMLGMVAPALGWSTLAGGRGRAVWPPCVAHDVCYVNSRSMNGALKVRPRVQFLKNVPCFC